MIKQGDWDLICTLYECRSITKTSELLYITQPALTRRIHQLEEELGITIVLRNAKGVEFTPQGELVVQYAKEMKEKFTELTSMLAMSQKQVAGTLRIAASYSLTEYLLPTLLREYKEKYPLINFDVSSNLSRHVARLVLERKAQVGFIRGEHDWPYEKYFIGMDQAQIVCTRPFSLEELPGLPRIDFYADQTANSIIDHWWFENFNRPPYVAMTVKNGNTCYEMVKNGLGYGIFLSSDFIADKADLYKIPMVYKSGEPVLRKHYMIYRPDMQQIGTIRSFLEFAMECFNGEKYYIERIKRMKT